MKSFFQSFIFAANGIQHAFVNERNFLIQAAVAAAVLILSWVLEITRVEWMVLLINIGLVLGFEMMNTCIERICNLIHPQHSNLVKIIKDVAAAAVLLLAIMATICGLIIFIPKIL